MTRTLAPFLTAGLVLLALIVAPKPASNLPLQVGTTASVKKEVVARLEDSARMLQEGDEVHQAELIETAAESEGEFILRDDTKLALGPNSQITLDRFVYDPEARDGDIVINATKGAFRFITGSAKKSAYTIKTPVASIGVRGTVFDGYVNDEGEIAVLLMDGEVDICNTGRECRRLNRTGYFVHVGRGGVLGKIRKWDGTFMKGVAFGRAFPFVGRKLKIDRVRRFKRADLMGKALGGRVPVKALDRRLPVKTQGVRKLNRFKRAVPRLRRPRIPGFGR